MRRSGNRLGEIEVGVLLGLAEVARAKQFLQTYDLGAARRRGFDVRRGLFEIRGRPSPQVIWTNPTMIFPASITIGNSSPACPAPPGKNLVTRWRQRSAGQRHHHFGEVAKDLALILGGREQAHAVDAAALHFTQFAGRFPPVCRPRKYP